MGFHCGCIAESRRWKKKGIYLIYKGVLYMLIKSHKSFSKYLGKDMEFKVYGNGGKPCIVFPSEGGRFIDFENEGMINAAEKFIEAGKIQFFCCDSNYEETWLDENGDPRTRMEKHELWYEYVVEELVPQVQKISQTANGKKQKLMTCGCSIGGFQALNFLLRRPDIFDLVLSMSAMLTSDYFMDYRDELTYYNSPLTYLPEMANDHEYIDLYNKSDITLCCGQGSGELEYVNMHKQIEEIFASKGINGWVTYWGYDVTHDYNWWKRQLAYFLQFLN